MSVCISRRRSFSSSPMKNAATEAVTTDSSARPMTTMITASTREAGVVGTTSP